MRLIEFSSGDATVSMYSQLLLLQVAELKKIKTTTEKINTPAILPIKTSQSIIYKKPFLDYVMVASGGLLVGKRRRSKRDLFMKILFPEVFTVQGVHFCITLLQ